MVVKEIFCSSEVCTMVKFSVLKPITAAIVLSLIFCSCGESNNDALPGYKEISAEEVSYDLYVPEGWVVDEQRGYTSAHISDMDTSNISVMAYELSRDTLFPDNEYSTYWKNTVEPSLKQMFPDLEYVTECENYKLDQRDAAQYIYTFTVDHGKDNDGTEQKVKYKVQQIILKDGFYVYTLTYTAREDQYSAHETEVSDIWYNFRLH